MERFSYDKREILTIVGLLRFSTVWTERQSCRIGIRLSRDVRPIHRIFSGEFAVRATKGRVVLLALAVGMGIGVGAQVEAADTSVAENEIRGRSKAFAAAFNERNAERLAKLFAPNAELVDDAGVTHSGRDAIQGIFHQFFEAFPEAQVELEIDTIRFASDGVAIEDGTRTVIAADGKSQATNRYMAVHIKQGDQWHLATAREVSEDPEPTPRDRLESLSWLAGNWVDEDAESTISIDCHWDKTENFLLVDFLAEREGQEVMNSRQRIGWDPLSKRIRSWVFDSDGGYGEGHWTEVDGKWIIKSTAVLPDGTTGSATIFLEPIDDDRFLMKGFDRVLGKTVEPDFEAVIVRQPPQPAE